MSARSHARPNFLLLALLAACGGGGGENLAPVASAGADRDVAEGLEATLDGSGSSDDDAIVSFTWTQIAGPSVTILDADQVAARFVAPTVDVRTALEFQLDVADAEGLLASDTVVLTVDEFDDEPDAFAFVDADDVALDAIVTSEPVTLGGFNTALPISVVGGTYAIDSGDDAAFTDAPGTVVATNVIRLRRTAASANGEAATVTLTVGSFTTTWTVTTEAPVGAPSAELEFPIGSAEIPSDAIHVRGHAAAVPGRTVASVSIAHATGTVAATLDVDGTFRADVPLVHGDNTLVVRVVDDLAIANAAAASVHVRRDHPIRDPVTMDWHEGSGRLLAFDNIYDPGYFRKPNSLVALHPTTLATDVISGPTRGTGPMWRQAHDVEVVGAVAYVLDANQNCVFTVDVATGNRSVLSGATTNPAGFNVGTGVFGTARAISYDAARARLLMTTNGSANPIVAIRLVASGPAQVGDRTIVAGPANGSGTAMTTADEIVVSGDVAFVWEVSAFRLVRVDLVTGARSILSVNGDGKGLDFGTSGSVSIVGGLAVASSGTIYASDFYADAIVAIDATTGQRTRVSDATTGSGVGITTGYSVVLDPSGGTLYLADESSGRILAIDLANGNRSTLHLSAPFPGIGNGIYTPVSVVASTDGTRAYVGDYVGGRISVVTLATGQASPLTSDGGSFTGPTIGIARAIAVDAARNRLLVLCGKIVAVDLATGNRTLVSGTVGPTTVGTGEAFSIPLSMAFDAAADAIYVAQYAYSGGYQSRILRVALANGDRSTVYSNASDTTNPIYEGFGLALDPARSLAFAFDEVADVLYTVDLAAANLGARAPFSSGDDPADPNDLVLATGPDVEYPSNLVRDAERHELVLWDDYLMRLVGIDDVTGNRTIRSAHDVGRGIAMAVPATNTIAGGGADNAWDMLGIGAGPTRATIVGASNMHNGVLLIDLETGDRVTITP